jgi:hypothetical protein
MMIFYEQEYQNEKGQVIIQRHIKDGIPTEFFPEFLGVGFIHIQTPAGEIQEKIFVPILADNIIDAFEKHEAAMKEDGPSVAEKMMEEMRQSILTTQEEAQRKIIMPSSNISEFNPL